MSLSFQPLLSGGSFYLAVLALIAAIMACVYTRQNIFRVLAVLLFGLYLFNPQKVHLQKTPVRDTAVIILDDSGSQKQSGRIDMARDVHNKVVEAANKLPGMEAKALTLGTMKAADNSTTNLGQALREALANTSFKTLAGVIVVTDGLAHDLPMEGDDSSSFKRLLGSRPVHFIITKKSDELDIRLEILNYNKRGLVDDSIAVELVAHSNGYTAEKLKISITDDKGVVDTHYVTPNQKQAVNVQLKHPGNNSFRFDLEHEPGELSQANNSELVTVRAARERVKALLVTGKVYAGQRVWRNYLKADPAIDLVHFNILRNIMDDNRVPGAELSLIPFPVGELFGDRLKKFDLVIIDQFPENPGISELYLKNMAAFVKNGGSLLLVAGDMADYSAMFVQPDFASVLPFKPFLKSSAQKFTATLSTEGAQSPITAPLSGYSLPLGSWYRVVEATASNGARTLLQTPDAKPLLLVNDMGRGRVAALMSDQAWLWARGHEGGAPYRALVKNIIHWLLREPELEEKPAYMKKQGDGVVITSPKHSLVSMVMPDGNSRDVTLEQVKNHYEGKLGLDNQGVVSLSVPGEPGVSFLTTIDNTAVELKTLTASTDKVASVANDSRGAVFISSGEIPALRAVTSGSMLKGSGWLGLKNNNVSSVTATDYRKIFPDWFILSLIILSLLAAWWSEHRGVRQTQ